MSDPEIVELNLRRDFNAIGHQLCHIIGGVRASTLGVAPEYIECEVLSVHIFFLRKDQSMVKEEITHLLDFTERGELERLIEEKYRYVKALLDSESEFDFPDGGAA